MSGQVPRHRALAPSLSRSEGEGWGGVLLRWLAFGLNIKSTRACGARTPPRPSPSPSAKGREKSLLFSLALCIALLHAPAFAQSVAPVAPPEFTSTAEEARFHRLVSELRCVMCQNQSLADSNAQIAQDLRREVLELMRQGKSDAEIKDFLVARYGEFVLYRPRVASSTWLLWFGPVLVLLAGGVLVAQVIRKRSRPAQAATEEEEQEW